MADEITKNPKESRIGLALYSQAICTAIQIALVNLFRSWGITPASVTGHSSGEIAAAYTIGALTWEHAMEVAYYRGVASSNMRRTGEVEGAMMAVGMSEEDIRPYISALTKGKVAVACLNSPTSTTVSGDLTAIDELQAELEDKKLFARKLAVEVAYHSHHMDSVAEEYSAAISGISPIPGQEGVQFFSSVTGDRATASDLGPAYWVRNMLGQVKFAEAARKVCVETTGDKKTRKRATTPAVNVILEIGPHAALAGPIKQIIQADPKLKTLSITYLSALVRKSSAVDTTHEIARQLITRGYPIAIPAINRPVGRESHSLLVDLPPYPWSHAASYWAEPRLSTVFRNRKYPRTDLLGALDRNSNPLEPRWRNHIRTSEIPWINDHKVQSNIVYPAAGYIAMAIEAAFQRATERSVVNIIGYQLREVTIGSALVIPEDSGEIETLVTVKPHSESVRAPSDIWDEFCVFSVTEDNVWTEHCRGLVSVRTPQKSVNIIDGDAQALAERNTYTDMIAEAEEKCVKDIDVKNFYTHLADIGLEYGTTFANMTRARSARNLCIARIAIPDTAAVMPLNFQYPFVLHPATLDSMLHPIFVALSAEVGFLQDPAVPVFLGEISVAQNITSQPGEELTVYNSTKKKDERYISASMAVFDNTQTTDGPVLTITDLECTILARGIPEASNQEIERVAYNFKWAPDVDLLSSADVTNLCGPDPLAIKNINAGRAVEPSPLMRENGYPEAYRKENPRYLRNHWAVGRYFELLGHQNPYLSILEISTGTGGALSTIMQALGGTKDDVPRFERYTYTEVGNNDSDHIKERFAYLSELINYKKLDIAVDPLKQGYEAASYDVIVADHVLCSGESITATLKRLCKLLKPGGRVILIEMTRLRMSNTVLFGTLPDLGADQEPIFSEQEWHSILLESGFSGLEAAVRDNSGELEQQCSMMVSRVVGETTVTKPDVLVIIEKKDSKVSLDRLLRRLGELNISVEISAFAEARPEGMICIVLSELSGSLLNELSPDQFDTVKQIFIKAAGVLWIVRGAYSSEDPNSSLVLGLARTARSEIGSTTIVTLALDAQNALAESAAADTIFSLFKNHFILKHAWGPSVDVEYAERNGVLMIPRIVENNALNQVITSSVGKVVPKDQPFHQSGRPLRLNVTPGFLDTIHFVDDERFVGDIPDDCVEIEVKAVGLNFKDVMMGLGQIHSEALGGEASGIISGMGKSVSGFALGDRVSCYGFGTFSNFYRGTASAFQKIPEDMTFELGAALPVTYCTAYYSVYHLARVTKEDSVLIHAATGGLGQAIIELCQLIGADIFVTVGTPEKKALLINRFGISEDHIFFSRDGSFASGIMRMTGGKGADVIMNSLAGEALRLTWNCIAPYGRFIELGARDLTVNTRLEMTNFLKNPLFAAFNLVYLIRNKRDVADKVWADVMDLFRSKSITGPTPLHAYPMSAVEDALRMMQTGKHVGKLVVVAGPSIIVKVCTTSSSPS